MEKSVPCSRTRPGYRCFLARVASPKGRAGLRWNVRGAGTSERPSAKRRLLCSAAAVWLDGRCSRLCVPVRANVFHRCGSLVARSRPDPALEFSSLVRVPSSVPPSSYVRCHRRRQDEDQRRVTRRQGADVRVFVLGPFID